MSSKQKTKKNSPTINSSDDGITSIPPIIDAETTTKQTFEAIKDLINDLNEVFSNLKSMKLYYRLLQNITIVDTTAIQKCITGFKVFFTNYGKNLESIDLLMEIPRDTFIRYGDSANVYLEIQKYLYKSNNDQREIIRRHLLTISASIDPNERTLNILESSSPLLEKMGLNAKSSEGMFVEGVMKKAKKAMENNDSDDPTSAVMNLFTSGVITDMVKGLQTGVNSKSMNVNKLLSGMQGALSEIIESAKNDNDENSGESSNEENGSEEDPNATLEGFVEGIQNSLSNKNKAKELKKALRSAESNSQVTEIEHDTSKSISSQSNK